VPSARAFFPAANETQYITWEQDFAGMNNARLQVRKFVETARQNTSQKSCIADDVVHA